MCHIRFRSFWKSAQTFIDAIGMENIAATGQDFMSVCLVTDVPDKLIVRCIENIMESDSKLDNSE
jgi:hypothetical protein